MDKSPCCAMYPISIESLIVWFFFCIFFKLEFPQKPKPMDCGETKHWLKLPPFIFVGQFKLSLNSVSNWRTANQKIATHFAEWWRVWFAAFFLASGRLSNPTKTNGGNSCIVICNSIFNYAGCELKIRYLRFYSRNLRPFKSNMRISAKVEAGRDIWIA